MPLLTAGLTFYFKKTIRHFEMKPLEYIEGDCSTARFKRTRKGNAVSQSTRYQSALKRPFN